MSEQQHSCGPTGKEDELIASLVGGLRPVRPLRLLRSIAVSMLFQTGVVLLTAWLLGARVVEAGRLEDPKFLLLLLTLGGGAGASAAATTSLAIPGRVVPVPWRLFVLALPLLLAVFVVLASPWGGIWKGFLAVFIEGFDCTRHTLLVAIPAWLTGLVLLRRLGALDPLSVGLFSATSALLTAALVVQMACPHCDSWHLAISHYMPIPLAAWLAAIVSPVLLGRPGGRGD